jgi:hypothetical protein
MSVEHHRLVLIEMPAEETKYLRFRCSSSPVVLEEWYGART